MTPAPEVEKQTGTTITLRSVGTALGGFGYRREHPAASLALSAADAVARKLEEERAVADRMVEEIAQQHERIRRLAALGARVMSGSV